MIHLHCYIYSISFILLLINSINTSNLRCYEDFNSSYKLIEHCRACVIFIDTKIQITDISHKKNFIHDESSIQDLFLSDENKEDYYHHHRHRRNTDTIIHQKCAREYDGPLYGFDQTHCYCNSDLCNSNIQRCIYEIASKRYFSCYHGSNSSINSLEIYKKCRSCRIKNQFPFIYHYECLTFGEQEQSNHTHCTCQHPMCNQDFTVCQRFQQIPSQPRLNSIQKLFVNSTKTTTTTTLLITNQTEIESTMDNFTSIEFTSVSYNDTNQTQTTIIQIKNHAHFMKNFSFFYLLYVIISSVF